MIGLSIALLMQIHWDWRANQRRAFIEDSVLMRCTSRSWLCDARANARKSKTDASATSRKFEAELSRKARKSDAKRRYSVPGVLLRMTASKCSEACAACNNIDAVPSL